MMHTFDFATFPVADTAALVAEYLTDIVKESKNDRPCYHSTTSHQPYPTCTPFHARRIPSIDVHAYLTRILKYCPCTNDCLIAVVVYLERMISKVNDKNGHAFVIDSYNIHRLIIVAFMISSKFFSDIFYTNVRYSKVGGLAVSELNSLEIQFLKLNDFNINIDSCELQRFANCLLNKTKPTLDIPKLASVKAISVESPLSSVSSVTYQSWSLPSTPPSSRESTPIIFNSAEIKNACYFNKSITSAELVVPLKQQYSEANIDSIIQRPDTIHATSINQYFCSAPLHSRLDSYNIELAQTGEYRDPFRKLSIQSGRTYGSNLIIDLKS